MRKRKWKFQGHDEVKLKRVKSKLVKFEGTLTTTPAGFGFVKPSEKGDDVFIPPRHLGGALDGDTVEVALLDQAREPGKGPVGKVVSIVERGRTAIVGELLAGYVVRPLSKRLPEVKLSGSSKNAKRGDWVKIRLLSDGSKHTEVLRGSIEGVYGRAGQIEADLLAVAAEHELRPPYSEEDNEEAAKLPLREIDRADFTDRICATIDPVDAKDFDDAISIADGKEPGQVELGVHIADVAAWVTPNSKWDKEAKSRSFSAYLPGMFMPMLPKKLTRRMCLTEGVESPAHSVIFTVRESDGAILSHKRTRSKIKVTKRLNFDEVQDFIEGNAQSGWDAKLTAAIKRLVNLTRLLRKRRKEGEEFLHLATTEIRVLVDEETKEIKGLSRKTQRESDKLVEDCMLAANSAVASELIDRGIPGLFRIHPEPNPDKLAEFSGFVEDAFGLHTGDLSDRKSCNAFIASLPDDHKRPVILSAFLRSLPRAMYSAAPEIHFGLGKYKYSHFTSPIRRYPDLLVHQQLWAADCNGKLRSKKTLEDVAEQCSKREERNDDAYYAANDRLKIHYLEQTGALMEGKLFEAVVSKVSVGGMVCEVLELGLVGFVPLGERGHHEFRKSQKGGKLKSIHGHTQYKVGDFVYLTLDRIDVAKGSAVFRVAS